MWPGRRRGQKKPTQATAEHDNRLIASGRRSKARFIYKSVGLPACFVDCFG